MSGDGAGDTAAEEALYLSKLSPKVHMLVRRDEMRASKIMRDRVKSTENIQIHWNTEAVEVVGGEEVEGVRVVNNKTKAPDCSWPRSGVKKRCQDTL